MNPCFELKILKNTLPYIQPYSLLAKIITGNNGRYVERSRIIGNYKNQVIAEKAKKNFEHLLINEILPPEFEDYKQWQNCKRTPYDSFSYNLSHIEHPEWYNPIKALEKRMKSGKEGDLPPKLPPSKKRKIIL